MSFNISRSNSRVITLKNLDGTVAGTIRITNPTKKKLKRIKYNFKEISAQILRSKTSVSSSQVVVRARGKVAMLQRMLRTGEYDDKALENAIIHAKKMVRIAKKKTKHLKEEEKAKYQGFCSVETNQNNPEIELEEEEDIEEAEPELSDEELKRLMQEFQELMKESMSEMGEEMGLGDLAEELTMTVQKDMSPEDLENLKKKHRAEELKEIMQADMKYLKALFEQMEKEKQGGSVSNSSFNNNSNGVSLQLGGMELPVQVQETPVITEGGSIDVSI